VVPTHLSGLCTRSQLDENQRYRGGVQLVRHRDLLGCIWLEIPRSLEGLTLRFFEMTLDWFLNEVITDSEDCPECESPEFRAHNQGKTWRLTYCPQSKMSRFVF
jgi:hypothetical protein